MISKNIDDTTMNDTTNNNDHNNYNGSDNNKDNNNKSDDDNVDENKKKGEVLQSWWRHQMETFSALLAICAGNSPVTGEFPQQRPVNRSFDVFFALRLNTRLSKQWRGWRFETPSRPLWRHCNDEIVLFIYIYIYKYYLLARNP